MSGLGLFRIVILVFYFQDIVIKTHHCFKGVFPEGVEGELISSYGFCDTPLLDPVLYDSCVSDTLTFEAIMKNTFPKHVDVPFAYIQAWFHFSIFFI